MSTIYLIDGNSYIYRAYYAIRGLSTSRGIPTNAVYGFTNMILKILKDKKPDYFVIVFDAPGPTKRHEAYEEYKAHRPGMPDDLKPQVRYIKEIIDAFRIKTIERPGYEADDILAAIAKEAESRGLDVCIVTGDKDMSQIVSQRIKLYDTMKEKITEEKDVIERFGVKPSQFPEIIALMGDTSDNIPGAPGIGEKTAVKLLKEFGSLDKLLENCEKIKNNKAKKAVSENMENIKLSLDLATVHPDVPLDVSVDDLRIQEPAWSEVSKYFRQFEFSSLIKMIPDDETTEEKTEYTAVLDKKLLETVLSSINEEVSVDTETTSQFPMDAELVGISLCINEKQAYYIPLSHFYSGVPEQLSKEYVLGRLKMILEDPRVRKTGHNIKYDFIVFRNENITMGGIAFDTMIASYLINPNKTNHSLNEIAMDYLGTKKLTFNDVIGKDKKNFREVPIEDATKYSGEDAAFTLKLKNYLAPALKQEGLEKLFHEIEMPLTDVLSDMEMAGVKINLDLMTEFSNKIASELSSIEKRIFFLAGEEFNINSPRQLQEILFEKLGLNPTKKTKTGYSTNIDVLEQLALQHELPKEIIEYRMLSKLKSTYVDALPRLVNRGTGRLHTSFNQTITATGRLSSSEPNLQNIPIRGEWGKRIREAFIAEKGNILISSDYSQIELRILAHLSGDDSFIEVFNNDGDIHMRTACELFSVSPENVTADMRRRAKTVNFGIIYGISPYGLSQQLGISPDEARSYIDTYFARHRGIKKYIDNVIRQSLESGFVTTLFNRKRHVPELISTNRNIRQLGERLAINSPIQGSAADIIKVSMINIWNRLKKEKLKSKMLLQVHDELLFEVEEAETKVMESLIREEMEGAVKLNVSLKVDIGAGKNWSEAH